VLRRTQRCMLAVVRRNQKNLHCRRPPSRGCGKAKI